MAKLSLEEMKGRAREEKADLSWERERKEFFKLRGLKIEEKEEKEEKGKFEKIYGRNKKRQRKERMKKNKGL